MTKDILSIINLTKEYKDFTLDNITFSVPYGCIVGLIGENGAGKSTIIKAISEVIVKDSGEINFFGSQDAIHFLDKEKIAVVFDGNNFPDMLNINALNSVLKNIYPNWDEKKYFDMCKALDLPTKKIIKKFSKGMQMKLSIIVAFCHNANLMILDEATSGLDPVIREEVLDMLLEFIQTEENAVLVSSHITSDLEKIADYIVFIHDGKVLFNLPKDELMYNYGIAKCGENSFNSIDKSDIKTYRKKDLHYEILVSDKQNFAKKYGKIDVEPATIDEIMLLYIKGETR